MALDGIFLHSIVIELKQYLINSKIDKVNQPEKDEIILTIRCSGTTKKLLISASSNYPRIHFTNTAKQNPMQPPMFCMVLRKYLIGSRIIDIRQIDGDRLLVIDVESSDELGFNSIYSIVVEIMGRHSNITLLRQRDSLVMDSIKHITPDINSYRSLYPGIKYIYPPSSQKLNPFDFSLSEFRNYVDNNNYISQYEGSTFSKIFSGVSTTLSKEIYYNLKTREFVVSRESLDMLYNYLQDVFSPIKENRFKFLIYSSDASLKDFYCIELHSLFEYKATEYESPSELLEAFYFQKDKIDRLNSKSADLQKLLTNNLDRCYKKEAILNNTLQDCGDKDFYKIQGELLTANIYSIKKGDTSASVYNYYSETPDEYITIKLDEHKTPSENIQYYFKKYNKMKKSEEAAIEQLENNQLETDYLQSVLTSIRNCETYEEIEEIRNELVDSGYIKFKKSSKNNKIKASKPLHFISSDNIDIYVGKNNVQNDYLTLKFADKNDIWLHTKNIPGSHVIIKYNGEVPESTLEEAAILAAYYSKGKDSSKVPVDYTNVKNVKKPSGAKPGMVIYYTNKTLYVTPYELNLKKINS
jgi:predicted ribosome quality control (RQC) complex YloA/Tae2 family protein